MINGRKTIQSLIDRIQFQFDIFPRWRNYQPLPWLDLKKVQRGDGTNARWRAIEDSLVGRSISSGMDIGCNLGYFCFALSQKGIPMLGIDMNPRYLRIAQYAAGKIGNLPVGLCRMEVSTETVCLLPRADLVFVLSVWHHWVRYYGLEHAGEILSAIWERCDEVLFFETGEVEMSVEFGLPEMGDEPHKWLDEYLHTTCAGSDIAHLGSFKAFAPLGNENRNVVFRNLFMLTHVKKDAIS